MVKFKIRLIRPLNLIIVALTMLVIFFKYRNEEAENFMLNIVLVILPAILTAAAGYIVNDIYDIGTDSINRPSKIVVGQSVSVRQAWVLYFSVSILSIGISYIFSSQYAVINFCISLLLYFYSLKLKGLPLIGNLVVAICSSAVIAICILADSEGERIVDFETKAAFFNFSSYIIFSFFISLIREVVKDMQDVEGDRISGMKTYPIMVGIKGAKVLVYIFCGMEILFCGLYSFFAFWMADMYASCIIMGLISISLFFLINRLSRAKSSDEFGTCSIWLKYIMFAGVINLIFS
jgi:4-hydroxybenzoate polyprenyltransferase